ncbi:MAG: Arm DNA-binding domain-containing protein, partial [Thermovirgaceae bacterium]
YPEVTLVRAREKAREAREMIEQGKDPVEEKQAMKRALAKQSKEKGMTFEVAARLCFEKKAPEFRCVFRSNSARVSEQLGHPVGVIRPD